MLKRISKRLFESKPEYVEKYVFTNGLAEGSLGGYGRLVRNFPMRRIRDQPTKAQMDNDVFYNHLLWRQRFSMFFKTKKRRLLYIFLFALTFNFTGNFAGMIMAQVERKFKKKKREYLINNYPDVMVTQSA